MNPIARWMPTCQNRPAATIDEGFIDRMKKAAEKIPTRFDETADCGLWEETLRTIFKDDPNKIKILQEFFGYCLYPEIIFPSVMFAIGDGSNGKSLVGDILEKMLGSENVCHIAPSRMEEPFNAAEFNGKNANIVHDARPRGFAGIRFKHLIAGDEITTSVKYKDDITFKPFAKHYICMNTPGSSVKTTKGVYRRVITLEFKQTFTRDNYDPFLKEKLEPCLDGVFMWALAGLARLFENKDFSDRGQACKIG